MPITLSRQQLSDLYRQSRGFGENALSMLTGGIGEPVAGFASLAALARGENAAGARDAVRDAFTYQPRTAEGQGQQRMLGELAQSVVNSAPVRTWQRGVDFAGRASPVAGATLQTVPTALGALTGYKQAMQTGRAVSLALAQAQRVAMENAMTPRVLHPQRGVFAGINALTADHEALRAAQEMAKNGASPDDIWQTTGWGVGADGKWRFEIDDSSSYMRGKGTVVGRPVRSNDPVSALVAANKISAARADASLGDIFAHQALYDAYPDMKNISTWPSKTESFGGRYSPDADMIEISRELSGDSARSVALHEIGHAVQQREGFQGGGSPKEMGRKVIDARSEVDDLSRKLQRIENEAGAEADLWVAKYPDRVNDALNYLHKQGMFNEGDNVRDAVKYAIHDRDPSYQSLTKQWRQAKEAAQQSPTESYRRLAGEVEARNIQSRADMNAQERRATHPRKTADVAEKDQIR